MNKSRKQDFKIGVPSILDLMETGEDIVDPTLMIWDFKMELSLELNTVTLPGVSSDRVSFFRRLYTPERFVITL